MIKGKKRITLTPETILQRISEYDIFRYYMGGRKWKLNEATNSPFHKDDNPSFLIGNRFGCLTFIDFADTDKRGDCFSFVEKLHGISLDDALKMIDRDFGLGILPEHDTKEYQQILSEYKQPEQELGKRYSIIQVVTRAFTNEELAYWNEYHQDISDLKKNNIYSIDKLFFNRKKFPLSPTELRFAYRYDDKWKTYRPFSGKKNKWVPNNVPITAMDGKECIINCDVAFINKSKKDHLVISKIFPCSCAVQNESVGCFSAENVEYLKANSTKQILSFDSDQPGVDSSLQITKLFDFGYCNVPRKYLDEGIKDWADLSRKYGLEIIEKILKEKQIL